MIWSMFLKVKIQSFFSPQSLDASSHYLVYGIDLLAP